MKLRRRLMDIDGHLLSLGVEAERQHQIISQWESRNNKLYRRQSSHKWRNRPSTTSFNDVDDGKSKISSIPMTNLRAFANSRNEFPVKGNII